LLLRVVVLAKRGPGVEDVNQLGTQRLVRDANEIKAGESVNRVASRTCPASATGERAMR
jgi:hypothetical protein